MSALGLTLAAIVNVVVAEYLGQTPIGRTPADILGGVMLMLIAEIVWGMTFIRLLAYRRPPLVAG
jgi:hypothetical protein